MTTYTGAADVIPGNLDGLDGAAVTMSATADSTASLSADLRKAVDSTEDFWTSPSGTAYRVSAQKQIGATGMLVGPLDTASQAFGTLAGELRGARSTVERALADSVAIGMGPTNAVGAGSTRMTAAAANRAGTVAATSTMTGPAGPSWSAIYAAGTTGPSPMTLTGRST